MSSQNCNTRLNSLTLNKESTLTKVSASNDAIVEAPSQTNSNTYQFYETASLIINLKKKMTSRFHGRDNELFKLKDVIINNFQVEDERLRKKNAPENKILTLESDHNSL